MPPSSNRSRWPLFAAGGCILLLACAIVAGAAGALLYLRRPAASVAAPNVEYILDASPRMLDENAGATRLSVAQGVLAEIVRPASTRVAAGLRVFGSGASGAGACQDTALLVPLAPANQAAISDRVSGLQGGLGVEAALGSAAVAAIRDLAATRGKHALVVVTGGADSCNPQAGQLVAQEAARRGIDLQLFVVGFQVTDADGVALKGLVDQTSGAAYIKANNAAELRQALAAIQIFIDQPNGLTVANVSATAAAPVVVTSSGPTPTALNTGLLQLSVLGYAGQPAETGARLIVRAFSPQDHQTVLANDYANPTAMRLPAGRYDLHLTYEVAWSSPYMGGQIDQWVNGLDVQSGQTTSATYDLKLGQVSLTVLEAPGKPVPDGNYGFGFRVYHAGDLNTAAATVIVTSTATLQLLPGRYVLLLSYPNTELVQADPQTWTFEVKSGQALPYTFDLNLGHLLLEVDDAAGQPLAPAQVTASASPAAHPDTPFATAYSANPADLPLLAGTDYNVVLKLDTGQSLTLPHQQVRAGVTRAVKVSASDFK